MNKVKDSNQNIAKAILKIRQDNRLSQEQFAEIVGVTRQAVSRWEMGVSAPNINTLILVSEKFNIQVDEILKSRDVDEKNDNKEIPLKRDKNYSITFLLIGILGLISTPFLAEWQQKKNMELFKTAYEHSYDYIFEYPLSIILMLALMFIGLGIYFILKKKRRRFDEKND